MDRIVLALSKKNKAMKTDVPSLSRKLTHGMYSKTENDK